MVSYTNPYAVLGIAPMATEDDVEARGDGGEALALATELFWRRPSLSGYQTIRRLAQAVGRWEDIQPRILGQLADKGQDALLTDIHLDEGRIDEALVTVERVSHAWGGGGVGEQHVRVAQAAEATRPDAAIRIYLRVVESQIAQKSRPNYAAAAAYLLRVGKLYREQGQHTVFRQLVANLRQQHRSLRALQDEWNKAGL